MASSLTLFFAVLLLAVCRPIASQLKENEKQRLLDIHNRLRRTNALGEAHDRTSTLQPSAADMLEMVWDDELASHAQSWADKCEGEHDPDALAKYGEGENIAWSGPKSGFVDPDDMIEYLYYEIDPKRAPPYFNYDGNPGQLDGSYSSFQVKMALENGMGHYTQIVWASTQRIGCGMARGKCSFTKHGERMPDFLVCRYWPSGNREGHSIYAVGKPCSECPLSHKHCNKGLCSNTPPPQPHSTIGTTYEELVEKVPRIKQPLDAPARDLKEHNERLKHTTRQSKTTTKRPRPRHRRPQAQRPASQPFSTERFLERAGLAPLRGSRPTTYRVRTVNNRPVPRPNLNFPTRGPRPHPNFPTRGPRPTSKFPTRGGPRPHPNFPTRGPRTNTQRPRQRTGLRQPPQQNSNIGPPLRINYTTRQTSPTSSTTSTSTTTSETPVTSIVSAVWDSLRNMVKGTQQAGSGDPEYRSRA